jgi:hypothetical protein
MSAVSPQAKARQRAYRKRWNAAHRAHNAKKVAERRARYPKRYAAYSRKYHRKRKTLMSARKSNPCMDCGRTFPPECMDWDHIRGKKTTNIARLVSAAPAKLEKEIAKCDLVCANCHRIRTVKRMQK